MKIFLTILVISLLLLGAYGFYNWTQKQFEASFLQNGNVTVINDDQHDSKDVSIASISYPPYYGKELENNGFLMEIVLRALRNKSYNVDLQYVPWERAVDGGKMGQFDSVLSMWYREDRVEFFEFSDPLPANELTLFSLKENNINFTELEDLQEYTIGSIEGYSYPENLLNSGLNFEPVLSQEQNFQKLLSGRVDLVVIDKALAFYILDKNFANQKDLVEAVGKSVEVLPQYFVVSKKNPDYLSIVQDFNQSLSEMKKSGEYDEILEKHNFGDIYGTTLE